MCYVYMEKEGEYKALTAFSGDYTSSVIDFINENNIIIFFKKDDKYEEYPKDAGEYTKEKLASQGHMQEWNFETNLFVKKGDFDKINTHFYEMVEQDKRIKAERDAEREAKLEEGWRIFNEQNQLAKLRMIENNNKINKQRKDDAKLINRIKNFFTKKNQVAPSSGGRKKTRKSKKQRKNKSKRSKR